MQTGMPDTRNNTRDAMSRALGAAFLNHQVEQLEKSVNSNNWRDHGRDRDQMSRNALIASGTSVNASPPRRVGGGAGGKKAVGAEGENESGKANSPLRSQESAVLRKTAEKKTAPKAKEKDGDVIVVDASVLVHALYQVKKWCRESREEIVIIPLEALNTLDLLKKGTSPLAQRARAASRILEAQVGTNKRIRVQRDDAFVLWDDIEVASGAGPDDKEETCPEWVRRIICCAKWEVDHAKEATDVAESSNPLVTLAILQFPSVGQNSYNALAHHAVRASGTLVAHWARRMELPTLEVAPSAAGGGGKREEEREGEEKKRGRGHDGPFYGPGRASGIIVNNLGDAGATKFSGIGPGGKASGGGRKGLVERPAAVMAMMQPGRPVVQILARGAKLDGGP